MWFKFKKREVVPTGKTSKKKKIIWLVVTLSLFLTVGIVRAGSLTPSGSPASTMRTLQEIYDSLAGTFDSTSVTATSTGSLVQILKYIVNNLDWVSIGNDISFTAGTVYESTTTLSSGNLNITTGVLQLASTTRINNLGQATLTTSSITSLLATVSSTIVSLNFTTATGTGLLSLTSAGTALSVTNNVVFGSVVSAGSSTLARLNFTTATGTGLLSLTSAGTALSVTNNATFGSLVSAGSSTLALFNFTTATGTGTLTVNTISASAAMTVGAIGQNLTLQGATTTIISTSSGPIIFQTNSVERMRITSSGLIGIGTTTPAYGFVVGNGTTQRDLDVPKGAICVDDATGAGCPAAPVAGTVYASTTAITAIDLAENYPTKDVSIEAGDIVSFDSANEGYITKATGDNKDQIVGIISTAPGVLLGRRVEDSRALALSGRVPVKVNNEGGAIKVGDPVTLSSVPGVGTKGSGSRVVGYSLENWDGSAGSRKIEVFVKLQPSPEEPTVLDNLKTSLNKLGLIIEAGILKVKTLVADLIQSKRVETDTVATNQLEMKDVDTGALYCVQIKSGEWVKTLGACGSDPSAVQVVNPPPANNNVTPPPPPPPTDTTPTQTETTSTSTTDTAATSTDTIPPPPAPDVTTSSDVQAP